MAYFPHPYATATPSPSTSPSSTKSRPKRPTITTTATAICTSPTSFLTSSSAASPSPITFARASVISPLADRELLREKKDRRRGLMKSDRSTAALDALLRAPEASPRAAPKSLTPQLTRTPTNASIKPAIQCLPAFSRSENGHESENSNGSAPTNRASSPTPSSGSGSGSAPSTPGQPRTPVSIELPYPAVSVAPLTICKANRTPSPIPPTKFKLHSEARTPSPTTATSQSKETPVLAKRQSRGRFHARTSSIPPAERIFAPLEVNTTAARVLDLSLESPRGVATLTGVLAEFEREVVAVPPVPAVPAPEVKVDIKMEGDDDDDESDWLDISDDRDPFEDAEFYRADIASHLQLISSYSFPPSSGRRPSYARHTRNGSSSSSISRWQHQLPPARPDSIPPPPHFSSSLTESESVASLFLPELSQQHTFPRRASASSLASTASGRSTRSNGSTSSKSRLRTRSHRRTTSRHSVARRSALVSIGRRSANVNRALPPTPDEKKDVGRKRGPSALLDPTYGFTDPSTTLWERLDTTAQTQAQSQAQAQRPPPRFSIPVSIVDEDIFGDDFFPPVPVPRPGTGIGSGMRFRMGSLVEEDEEYEEDRLIDPFVLDSFPMVDPSSGGVASRSDGGSTTSGEVSRNQDSTRARREGVDPFTIPHPLGRSSFPISPLSSTVSPLSPSPGPFSQARPRAQQSTQQQQSRLQPQPQPLLLVPESPSASSTSNSNETFDVETLYSSYASFSPSFSASLSPDNNTSTSRKDSTGSVYLDSQGRPLQSRWSVSTFASTAPPPTSSSTRSFFPKLASAATTVPSRLSARLKAARERAIQQAKEREEREEKERKEVVPVVRPYPFFPTPTPPSPKRKAPPGRYVAKPELMPQKCASEESGRSVSGESRNSSETVHSATLTPTSSASANTNMNTSTSTSTSTMSPKGKTKEVESQSQGQSRSPAYVSQFAQYRSYRRDQQQQQQGSPAGQTQLSSSPPRSLLSPGSRSRTSSTDSLSAFPFVLGGERLSSESRRSTSMELEVDAGSGSGMRRRPIPAEIFSRA